MTSASGATTLWDRPPTMVPTLKAATSWGSRDLATPWCSAPTSGEMPTIASRPSLGVAAWAARPTNLTRNASFAPMATRSSTPIDPARSSGQQWSPTDRGGADTLESAVRQHRRGAAGFAERSFLGWLEEERDPSRWRRIGSEAFSDAEHDHHVHVMSARMRHASDCRRGSWAGSGSWSATRTKPSTWCRTRWSVRGNLGRPSGR